MDTRSGIPYRLNSARRRVRGRFLHRSPRAVAPASAWTMTLASGHRAIAGVLDLAPNRGTVLDSGSVSLNDDGHEQEWAGPPRWWREARSSGTGCSNESDPVPKTIPLAERLSVVLQPPLALCMSASGPLEWPSELLGFQKDGIRVLVERPCVLLADDMGLGKTIQAVATMRLLVRRGELERILVVAPAAVIRNWRDELGKWAPELRVLEITGSREQRAWKWDARVHVKIVSYETLRSDHLRAAKRHGQWDLVCLDEAQRIKNSASAISGVVRSIASRRRWALTGTPLENSVDDLRSIISFLRPIGPDGRRVVGLSDREIGSALGDVQLRRKKSEVLTDLPPKMVTELFVPLGRRQREEYDILLSGGVDELRQKGASATVTDVLALITRLKQICNFSTVGGCSSKLDDIAARLAALRREGHKALVFSQFTNEINGVRRIARALSEFGPIIYTGDMIAQQRLEATEAFRHDTDVGVLILSLKAGGVGLNLQQASYVFHFDRWWNPASEAQADDRSHRIGQVRGVNVYKYICENTIEERIREVLQAKRALFAEYVDDVCLDLGERLTEDELFGLLDIEPPGRAAPAPRKERPSEMTIANLEALVRRRLEIMGYEAEITYPSGDGEIDLVAEKADELGRETVLLVRCMVRPAAAGIETVKEFGELLPVENRSVGGLIVCPSGFTDEAVALAEKRRILLWSASEIS
ncbi:MAG: SNF2-related protein [Armatimonadetes bacterium]|nr:SNF2-related protein [Armatimonadota bacterium]